MVETLFFSCYYAFLLGDLAKASMYFELLRQEFKNVKNADCLKSHQLTQLALIRDSIRKGKIARKYWVEDDGIVFDKPLSDPDADQDALVKLIHQNYGLLNTLLDDTLTLENVEHPCPPYGRVDMLYKGKKTAYPVEVKKGKGCHDLLGQIVKYDLSLRLKLHYNIYDFVQGITICGSYDRFTLNELKAQGFIPILYTHNDGILNLKKV